VNTPQSPQPPPDPQGPIPPVGMNATGPIRARGGWLTRNLLVLCGVSLLQDAASELIYPLLPLFLTVTLHAPVAVVGLVEGIAGAVTAGTQLAAGRVADRGRRRPLIAAGYGLAALGKAVIAFAGTWPLVLTGRAVDRVGKGVRGAPRDALLVSGIPARARGRAFGLHRAADTLVAVVGPVAGLALYGALDHRIRPLLQLAVLPAVLSVALVAAVRDLPPATAAGAPARARGRLRDLPTPVWRALAPIAVFAVVNVPDTLVLLRVAHLGAGVTGLLTAYAVYNASYAALSYPAGALSDRWARPVVFAAGLGCFAVAYLGLGLVSSTTWVLPLMVVYGGYTAATDGVGKAWISTLTPTHLQGSAQGLLQAVNGTGLLLAGLWAGLAWQHTGRVPLLLAGATAAVLAAVLTVTARTPRVDGTV